MKANKKRPLKHDPLRNPGQSLDEEISTIMTDKALGYIIFIAFSFFMMGMEWFRYFRPHPPNPVLFTIFFVGIFLFCSYRLFEIRKKIDQLKLGRDGEKAVGQFLEHLREKGARIIHDIPSDTFNIDHVVVSLNGIFLVETKMRSKPAKGQAIIDYEGDTLQFNKGYKDKSIIIQAKAGKKWLSDLIEELTGKSFSVQPVVVFPMWYINHNNKSKPSDVWVLEPKALPTFIDNRKDSMSKEDIIMVANHLGRYVRAYKKPKK